MLKKYFFVTVCTEILSLSFLFVMRLISPLLCLGFISTILVTGKFNQTVKAENSNLELTSHYFRKPSNNKNFTQEISLFQNKISEKHKKRPQKINQISSKIFRDSGHRFIASQNIDLNQSFSQTLETIQEITNQKIKANLLIDLAINYANFGNVEKTKQLLNQSLQAARLVDNLDEKVILMITIAKQYREIDQSSKANQILEESVELANTVEDKLLKSQLLMKLSLNYIAIGEEKQFDTLLTQSQRLREEANAPVADFPFQATPLVRSFGFNGSVSSFRDTTGFAGINLSLNQQWSRDDIDLSASLYTDFDSSRLVNNYKPGGLLLGVYRHHFSSQWNYFTTIFMAGNQSIFASENDDEDLSFLGSLALGGGLNVWRGDSPQEFLDLQLGVGPHYEYDYINFEKRRDEVDPALFFNIYGKGFAVGKGKVDTIFAVVTTLNDTDNYTLTSRNKFSFPLNDRWSLNNTLWLRYRNQRIITDNPKLEVFFTTGISYQF